MILRNGARPRKRIQRSQCLEAEKKSPQEEVNTRMEQKQVAVIDVLPNLASQILLL